MSNDVLITPASRKIEFKDSSANVDAKIETDASGNLVITNTGGDISIGDTTSDIFVGDGTNNIDIVFEQDGEIRGTTGVTVTLGQSDSNVRMATDLNLNSNDITNVNDLTVAGNLTVSGTTTTVNSTNTTIGDSLIELNSGLTGANAKDIGFIFERGSTGNNAAFFWDESGTRFRFVTTTDTGSSTTITSNISEGTVQAGSFIGNGSQLSSLNASNLSSGTVASARLSLSASDIPNLAASKITSGTFADARIPNLAGSKITSGTIDTARLPNPIHLSGGNAILKLQETDVTNSPTWWHVADGGSYSIRLNNTGTYPIQITTDSDNDLVTLINLGYGVSITGDLTASGNGFFNGTKLEGDSKEMIRFSDSWLRINPANEFTSGIYAGTGILRTDGQFQVGSSGSEFKIESNGNTTIAGNVTITGGNTDGSGNAFVVNRGGNTQQQALRIQNSGEVVVSANYLYAAHTGTSFYSQGDAVIRGNLRNDSNSGADPLTVSDKLNVTGDIQSNGTVILTATGRNLTNIGTIGSGVITATQLNINSGTTNTTAVFDSSDDKAFIIIRDDDTDAYLITKDGNFSIGNTSSDYNNFKVNLSNGNVVLDGTVDGRDIATDGTKLDTIATNADVTPSWVPSSDPGYLTSSSTQSKYLRSDTSDTYSGGTLTFQAPVNGTGVFMTKATDSPDEPAILVLAGDADTYDDLAFEIRGNGTGGSVDVSTTMSSADTKFAVFQNGHTVIGYNSLGPNYNAVNAFGLNVNGTISAVSGYYAGSTQVINSSGNWVGGGNISEFTNDSGYTTNTGTVSSLSDLSITSTAAELNKLDGYTGSVTELNYLDTLHATGVTSTEFDYLDGVTSNIQTQLNGKQASGSYLTASSTALDSRYYTESEMQTYFKRGYIEFEATTNTAVGWYTVATNTGDRAIGDFTLWDTDSGDHQGVHFKASHFFGTDNSNDITVLHYAKYSGSPIRYIRIKDGGTYDGAALQVYIDQASNNVGIAITGGNPPISGWVLKDWIPDATDPGDLSSYSSMGERVRVDLDLISNGGQQTSGAVVVGNPSNVLTDTNIAVYNSHTTDAKHYQIYHGTTRVGEIGARDTTWLRINDDTAKNIYTPRYIRADSGFFVDGSSKGINGSGNFVGGTITGASDANVSNWDTAYSWGNHASAGYITGNQTITLSGDVSGSGTTSISVTVADDSHNHVISNVDGLQTALDAKAPLASPSFTTKITTPAIHNSGKISFLNNSAAQGIRVESLYAGVTYANDGSAAGIVDTLNGYRVAGTTVVDSSRNITGNTITYSRLDGPGTSSRDKIRVYNNNQYVIGMQSGITFGGLNDWGMTFQFNDENDRGFWWGDASHSTAQGAMALTTHGYLTVANGIKVGRGESDTTTPGNGIEIVGSLADNLTLLTLTNGYSTSDLSTQETFIDFQFLDGNSNEVPQVRIGAQVGQNADANTQEKEGSGAFVVFTNNANTISGAAGTSLAERFRVDYRGDIYLNEKEVINQQSGALTIGDISANDEITTMDLKVYAGNGRIYMTDGEIYFNGNSNSTAGFKMIQNTGAFHSNGDVIAYSSTLTASDERLKENIEPLEGSLNKILKLKGVKYDWKNKERGTNQIGLIAQEVEKVVPEVVNTIEDSLGDMEDMKVVNYSALVPVLVEAVKMQQKQIDRLSKLLEEKS